jgi:MOSC domain-containing protein YiiM
MLGENLSVGGIDEGIVCVGNVFALGAARLKLTEPRRPCWKISHRVGVDQASRRVAERGLTGWYFRVLETGSIPPDATLALLDRSSPGVMLTRLWAVEQAHRPAVDEVRALATPPRG